MIMVITVTLLAAYALTTLVIYRQNVNLMEQETRQEANYIVKAIEISGTDYLKQMDEVEKNTRITLIDSAGDVLYDSTEDAVTLQNHKNRPEIKAAHKNGTGQEVRRSTTMSKEMFYYAKLLPDGNVLRVSKTIFLQKSVKHIKNQSLSLKPDLRQYRIPYGGQRHSCR